VHSFNVSAADYDTMIERCEMIRNAGFEPGSYAFLIDGTTAGWMAVQTLRRKYPDVFIHFHRAGHGAFTRPENPIGYSVLVLSKFARLAGASGIHTGTAGVGKMAGDKAEDVTAAEGIRYMKKTGHIFEQSWGTIPETDKDFVALVQRDEDNEEVLTPEIKQWLAFAKQKSSKNLKGIIPVVASIFEIDEEQYVAQEGITELIDMTYNLIPEGMQAAKNDVELFKLNRKRSFAHTAITAFTVSAIGIGAIPIPFSDAVLLSPLEVGEINAIAKIYGIENNKNSKRFLNSIIEAGTIGVAAKAAISSLKAIPGVNIAASVLNAIIAGSIVMAISEVCVYTFEQIYLGKKTMDDIDWINKIIESKLSSQIMNKINTIAENEDFKKGNLSNINKLFIK